MVYIQEAHPSNAWQVAVNVKENVVLADPTSDAERSSVARACVKDLGIEFPALVDGVDNTVEMAYTGWPDRLYVVDRDGRIALKSAPGPYGFQPSAVGDALARLVGE